MPITGDLDIAGRVSGDLTNTIEISGSTIIPDIVDRTAIHYDTTQSWNSQPERIALRSHLYIYSDYSGVNAAIKVGDGISRLIDLPFVAIGGLKSLAFKDSATGELTFTNSNQVVTVGSTSGEATYTPEGTVSPPTITVLESGATTTIKNPTKETVAKTIVTAAPSETAPDNPISYCVVDGENLIFKQIGYTTGDSITTTDVSVKTGDATYSASEPAFTGTGVRLVTDNISVPSGGSVTVS